MSRRPVTLEQIGEQVVKHWRAQHQTETLLNQVKAKGDDNCAAAIKAMNQSAAIARKMNQLTTGYVTQQEKV